MQNPKFEIPNTTPSPSLLRRGMGRFSVVGISVSLFVILLSLLLIPFDASALTRQLPLSGQLLTPGKQAVPDGDYTMRFAIYDKDRTASDPYPSDADSTARIWTETQTVKVERGLWKVILGTTTAFPDTLNFETGNYYLGIRINTDPEMVPRKKILPVPLALNAESLGGAKPGTGNNNILQLDSAGAVNIAGNITTAGILQGANLIVGTSIQLPANSILTADIMDGTISTIDLADGLITSVKISDSSIASAKLLDSAVSGAKLADNAVTVSKIGDGAITTIKLLDGSVSTAKLADLAVTTAKIADASITVAKLATGDLHFQNTDTGTTSLSFGLGTGMAIGTNNFLITASNAANKPAVRYNGTTGKWQISNDGTIFADIGSSLSSSLQAGYDAGNTITTTDGRNILFTLADTATDSSFLINIQGTGNIFQIQDAGTPIFTVADGGISTFGGNINLSGNRIVSASRIDGNASGSFLNTTVDVRGVYTTGTSLALDSSNYPHILYYTSDNSAAVIADWDGSQWTITDFDTTGTRGRNNDLVIDGAGVKHAAYQDEITADSDLIYAKFVGSGGNCAGSTAWNCTIVDSTGDIATNSNSIDVDGSNIPHISYYDNTNGNLKHAWFVGSGGNCSGSAAWNCETVESANNVGSSSAIAINRANGNIHISYYDTTNGDLRYVKYSGGSWGTPVNLDGSAGCIATGCGTRNAGSYSTGSNLTLNVSGNPRVSYSDYSSDDLYYVYSNDGGSTWTTTKIDGGSGVTGTGCATSGNYGQYSSLAIDSSGNPHISYYNYTSYDLRYASNNGSAWTCQTLDSANTVGLYTSIKMTSADKVYISYQNNTNIDLKLASNNYPKLNIYSDVAIMGETGNLGVGVLQPTERLDVAGNIKASGIISASDNLTAGNDLIVSDDAWIPTLFGSSSNNGALTLNSTSATPKGDIYINPGGQKTVIGNSTASTSLATAGLQITPNYLYLQYRYYNPGTGYTYSNNSSEANSYGGTAFTLASAVGDMAYFGSYQPFNSLEIDLATLGAGAGGAVAWEYWNGAWVALTATDGTANFTADGVVSFTPPSDWATTYVNNTSNIGYWIRANVTTIGYTTAPTANSTIIGRFGTTAAPLVAALIQPAGIADSTAWSATGTMLGINTPSSFNGNFIDLQVNGTSQFKVTSGGTILAVGDSSGTTPTSGAGTRMMWIPAKAAFRAGQITGTQWDDANIGIASVAMGYDSRATGTYSVAIGDRNVATGSSSTAIGVTATASGSSSVAIGCCSATASGTSALALGTGTTASGSYSRTFGSNSTASGNYAITIGQWLTGSTTNALVLGQGVDNTNRLINSIRGSLMFGYNLTTPTLYARGGGSFVATGTVSTTSGSATVTGSGTLFTTELIIGDRVTIGAETKTVAAIASAISLTVDSNFSTINSGATMTILPALLAVRDSSNNPSVFISDQGNVGIGTATINTASTLQVEKAGGTGTTNPLEVRIRNSTSQGSSQIVFEEGSQGDNFKIRYHSLSGGTNNWLEFFGGSDAIPRLTVKRDADIGYGQIGINVASGSDPLGNLDIRQYANGDQILYARRNTDTSPTGNFIQFQNAAGSATLFSVDITGSLTASGNVTLGANIASGTTTIDLGGTGTGNAVCHTTQTGTDNEGLVDCTSGPIADYAEMYPVVEGVDYGDIVAVGTKMLKTKDGENIVQLVKSSTPYQSTTIGIVSNNYGDFTSAGYNIRKEDNPMPVALNGRVPVKVSLENGPIAVGDPLTSSSTPGVAMKATGAGYVIGKALESFTELPTTNYSLPTKILVFINPGWHNPPIGPLVQGGDNEFDTINIGSLATTKDLIVTGLARIKGDLIVEGKVRGDLEVEGIIKTKGIVGGWRSYENHFLNSKFENEFTVSTGGANWEYHKIKLATDALVGSKATLAHSFNFKPADDENGATWRMMIKVNPINDLPDPLLTKEGQGVVRFGLYADEQNYALIQNGTEPQTLKFISCAVGECAATDNISVDPAAVNRNYVIMMKSGEVKLLIDGQEYAKHSANVPADSILHFHEEITTNIDASQSAALDYLGVIVGRYEPF